MKFLCDVHISYQIASSLNSLGFQTRHVNDILNGSSTKDGDICKYVDDHDSILITKDADFRNSYFIKRSPRKLIKINLGNISNKDLMNILSDHINLIVDLSKRDHFLLEIDKGNAFVSQTDDNESNN